MDYLSILISIVVFGLFLLCLLSIFNKAGFSGLLVVLLFIPVINIIFLLYLSFTKWPIEKELEELKKLVESRNVEKKEIKSSLVTDEKQHIENVEFIEAEYTCTKCGTPLPPGNNKCVMCGYKNQISF